MIVIVKRETTVCGSCGQEVTIDHCQIACRELVRLGFGPTPVGVVGHGEKALARARRRVRTPGKS
jgi:hypothetical protein